MIHKIRTQNKGFTFSECSRALHIVGGQATTNWGNVTCKQCLLN